MIGSKCASLIIHVCFLLSWFCNKFLSWDQNVQNCLESVNYAFTFNFRFLDLIRAYICYILLRASVSSALPVFQVCASLSALMLLLYMTMSVLPKFSIMGPTGFSIKTTRLSWDLVYLQLAVNVYMILLQRFRETLKVIVATWVLSNSTTA